MWSLSDGKELGMTSLLDRLCQTKQKWSLGLEITFLLIYFVCFDYKKMTTRMPDPVCE